MGEPIFDPNYWSDRLARAVAREQAHLAVYEGPATKWNEGRARQEKILRGHVNRFTSVLDVGCGWGRLLGIMPQGWEGPYVGVDICPEFIEIARRAWPSHYFILHDFRRSYPFERTYDLAVCCSIKPMVIRNAGRAVWAEVEDNIRRVARKILLLGYDDLDDEEGLT